jgi:antitoxin (DNA-binding transcriptional repressor) of toxin-antitoxin stability system
MSTVPAHELPEDMLPWVERARRGEEIETTEGDAVIASIAPRSPHPLSDLIASGRFRPPLLTTPMPNPRASAHPAEEAGTLMERLRDEERY